MAQTFNTFAPHDIATVALALVDNGLVIGADATHYTDGAFAPASGGTLNLKIPGALTARSRQLRDMSTAIVLDEIVEALVPVDLTGQRYSAVRVSDAELTLDIANFAKQVLRPQADAIIEGIEHDLANVLKDVDPAGDLAYNAADPSAAFITGRRALRRRGVDVASTELIAYAGGEVYDDLLGSGALDFDKTGDTEAIRAGRVGRVHGFRVVESSRIGEEEIVFTTRGGLYIATRAPQPPQGAAYAASIAKDGLALTYVRDYDASMLADRSIVSVFSGVGISPLYDVRRNHETGDVEVKSVEGGAVVKFDTSA